MDIQEHHSTAKLPAQLEKVCTSPEIDWGIVWVNRKYLKPMTNEALLMAMKPALAGAGSPHVFLDGEAQVFVLWQGEAQKIHKQLRGLITSTLTQYNSAVMPSAIVGFINPSACARKLKHIIEDPWDVRVKVKLASELLTPECDLNLDDTDEKTNERAASSLGQTPEQANHYNKIKSEKPYRKQLQILIAEDSAFSQKLLSEIIRGMRNQAGLSPMMDIVPSVHEAWVLFLKKAPDICFVDLRLIDGSGHALARAMKELDPSAHVIVLTANDYEEEVAVAQQNNVDGFIVKPYTKQQILESIDKYKTTVKSKPHRGSSF